MREEVKKILGGSMGRFATVCGLKANLLFVFFSDDFAIVSSFLLYLLVKFVETGCAMIQIYCYLVFYFPCFLLLSLVLIVCSYLKAAPFFLSAGGFDSAFVFFLSPCSLLCRRLFEVSPFYLPLFSILQYF